MRTVEGDRPPTETAVTKPTAVWRLLATTRPLPRASAARSDDPPFRGLWPPTHTLEWGPEIKVGRSARTRSGRVQAGPPARGRPSPARAGHAIGSRSPHLQRWPRWARRRAACRGLSARARPLTRGRAAEACHRRQLHRREHSCARRRAMPPRQRGWSNHVLERVPMRGALSAAACAATPGADARHRSSWSPEATSAPRAVRRRASPPAQPPLGPGLCPSANGRWAQVQARPARADPSGWAHRTPGTAPARGGGHPRRSTKRRRVRGQRLRGLARPACGTLQLYHYSSRQI